MRGVYCLEWKENHQQCMDGTQSTQVPLQGGAIAVSELTATLARVGDKKQQKDKLIIFQNLFKIPHVTRTQGWWDPRCPRTLPFQAAATNRFSSCHSRSEAPPHQCSQKRSYDVR